MDPYGRKYTQLRCWLKANPAVQLNPLMGNQTIRVIPFTGWPSFYLLSAVHVPWLLYHVLYPDCFSNSLKLLGSKTPCASTSATWTVCWLGTTPSRGMQPVGPSTLALTARSSEGVTSSIALLVSTGPGLTVATRLIPTSSDSQLPGNNHCCTYARTHKAYNSSNTHKWAQHLHVIRSVGQIWRQFQNSAALPRLPWIPESTTKCESLSTQPTNNKPTFIHCLMVLIQCTHCLLLDPWTQL